MEENTFDATELEQDVATEETDNEESQEQAGEETKPPEKQEEETEFSLPIKYNGKETVLDREQAVTLAQKGMNYDHVAQELQKLRDQSEKYSVIGDFAKAAGMTPDEYLGYLREQRQQGEIQEYEGKGVPREYAMQLVSQRNEVLELKQQLEELQSNFSEMQSRQENVQKWGAFLSAHPDVGTFENLPEEVKSAIGNGDDPEMAYTRWENEQLKAQLKSKQQAQKNKEKAPGSARGEGKGEDLDTFARAFMANL